MTDVSGYMNREEMAVLHPISRKSRSMTRKSFYMFWICKEDRDHLFYFAAIHCPLCGGKLAEVRKPVMRGPTVIRVVA